MICAMRVASHLRGDFVMQIKIRWRYVVIVLLVLMLLMQLQPEVVGLAGGVNGSFGVRPVSHKCFGFVVYDLGKGFLRPAELEFRLLRFYFRYSVAEVNERPLCVGQDIWYGE
jgi:hypothetical protein